MKKLLMVFGAITTLLVLFSLSQADMVKSGGGTNPQTVCKYVGIITNTSIQDNFIYVQTTTGILEFKYINDGKKGCVPFNDLQINNKVEVICKNKKEDSTEEKNQVIEAICVKIITRFGVIMNSVKPKGVK
jgi:hypothetical protein